MLLGDGRLAVAAESFDPAAEDCRVRIVHVDKFDAHADAGLDDADDAESLDDLVLALKPDAGAIVEG